MSSKSPQASKAETKAPAGPKREPKRTAAIERDTTETKIALNLTIEGTGHYEVATGIRFFDHMLELFTRHGAFDLQLTCKGDLDVDQHHTVEDVGIALGEAFDRALGDKTGINRAGYFLMPMDETLGIAAVDLSGRTASKVKTKVKTTLVGDLQSELVEGLFRRLCPRGARQRPPENHVRPVKPPQAGSAVQSICPRPARRLLTRPAARGDAAVHQGPAVIAVVDYKAGNLTSVMKAIAAVVSGAVLTDDPQMLERAERIVLPGVGHFSATQRLDATGLTPAIREAIGRGTPFLGICVGMQWLLEGSEEAPAQPGLGYFLGRCERFPSGREKVPHVGWNALAPRQLPAETRLLKGVAEGEMVYFTHSYFVPALGTYFRTQSGPERLLNPAAAITRYAKTFAAAVEHENVMGVQFHPEMSGATGLKILENFMALPC